MLCSYFTAHFTTYYAFPHMEAQNLVSDKNSPSYLIPMPNVFIHEPNEFIHVRVVNKLSKFKFTVKRLSDLVLTYSVGKGDFQIIPPSGWNLLSVTLWCLHPGHCYSSTHLLYNFVHYIQSNQFGTEHFFVRAKRALKGPDLAVPYRAFSSLH